MSEIIVVINAESATIKFAVYSVDRIRSALTLILRGLAESHAEKLSLAITDAEGREVAHDTVSARGEPSNALRALLDASLHWLKTNLDQNQIVAFGHRIVHGGDQFLAPVIITETILANLRKLTPLAPLHQPYNLAVIDGVRDRWPDLPQVGCFDTAFHHTQPKVEQMFALPKAFFDSGVKRYGFHGLSYEYIARVLPAYLGDKADGKVIVAHLGNGASLCAMKQRVSVATTMGFSTLDGLVMGTRSGSIDAGAILYLMDEKKMTSEDIAHLLYHESGLLGVSGLSADMRTLLASDLPHAAEAVELFVHRAVREIGSLTAALGGLDALMFTGGMGSHSALIRQRICDGSAWAGIDLDHQANAAHALRISANHSAASAWVIPTDEEAIIADHTLKLAVSI